MSKQISLRLPEKLLKDAERKAKMFGYSNVQEYITAEIRGDLYGEMLSEKEYELTNRFLKYVQEHPESVKPADDVLERMRKRAGLPPEKKTTRK